MFVQSGVNLTRAEDDAVDLVRRVDGVVGMRGVGDDPLEMGAFSEVFDVGASKGMTEKGLGEE